MATEDTERPQGEGKQGEAVNPETGFTPTEQAEFEAMSRDGSSPDDVADVQHGAQPDQGAQPDAGQQQQQPQPGDQPQPGADDDEGEEGDEGEDDGAEPQPGAPAKPGEQQQPGQQAKPGEQQPGDQGSKKKGRVSLAKLRKVEEERNQLAADAAKLREALARGDERLKIINEALATPQAQQREPEPEDKEPDPEKEPFEWMQWSRRQMGKLAETVTALAQGRATEQQTSQLKTTYLQDAQAFNQREPNFLPAYQYLMESRTQSLALYAFGKDLTAEGVQLTQQERQYIESTIAREEQGYIAKALERGQSPAQYIYALAKSMRYQPMAPEKLAEWYGQAPPAGDQQQQQQPAQQQQRPNGKHAQPGGDQQPQQSQQRGSVSDEVAKIRAGAEASLSLSQGGAAPQQSLSMEQLGNMSQAEFDALMNRLPEREQNRLLGG